MEPWFVALARPGAESGVDRGSDLDVGAEARIGRYGAVALAVHGEQSPCARNALEFVFTTVDEIDA
jgi:hypothetical protein